MEPIIPSAQRDSWKKITSIFPTKPNNNKNSETPKPHSPPIQNSTPPPPIIAPAPATTSNIAPTNNTATLNQSIPPTVNESNLESMFIDTLDEPPILPPPKKKKKNVFLESND